MKLFLVVVSLSILCLCLLITLRYSEASVVVRIDSSDNNGNDVIHESSCNIYLLSRKICSSNPFCVKKYQIDINDRAGNDLSLYLFKRFVFQKIETGLVSGGIELAHLQAALLSESVLNCSDTPERLVKTPYGMLWLSFLLSAHICEETARYDNTTHRCVCLPGKLCSTNVAPTQKYTLNTVVVIVSLIILGFALSSVRQHRIFESSLIPSPENRKYP